MIQIDILTQAQYDELFEAAFAVVSGDHERGFVDSYIYREQPLLGISVSDFAKGLREKGWRGIGPTDDARLLAEQLGFAVSAAKTRRNRSVTVVSI